MDKLIFDSESGRYILTAEYVTKETGVDLAAWLNTAGDSNPADVPRRFLKRVSMIIYNFIEKKTFKNRGAINADILAPQRCNSFCEALTNQVLYMVNNGDFGLQSGINIRDGRAMSLPELRGDVRISPDAIDCLFAGGFLYAGACDGGAL